MIKPSGLKITSAEPKNYKVVRGGIGHSASNKRRNTSTYNFTQLNGGVTAMEVDLSDLDYVDVESTKSGGGFSFRYTAKDYCHLVAPSGLRDAKNASDPHGLKKFVYPIFSKAASQKLPREQQKAIERHYTGATAKTVSAGNQNVKIALDAQYTGGEKIHVKVGHF